MISFIKVFDSFSTSSLSFWFFSEEKVSRTSFLKLSLDLRESKLEIRNLFMDTMNLFLRSFWERYSYNLS